MGVNNDLLKVVSKVDKEILPRKILFLSLIGSSTYGLKSEDIDAKGFYLPLERELVSDSINKYYIQKNEIECNIISLNDMVKTISTYSVLDCFFSPKQFIWINKDYDTEVLKLFQIKNKLSNFNLKELYLSYIRSIESLLLDSTLTFKKNIYLLVLNSYVFLDFYENDFTNYRKNLYEDKFILELLSDIKIKGTRLEEGKELFEKKYEKIVSLKQYFLNTDINVEYLDEINDIVNNIIQKSIIK